MRQVWKQVLVSIFCFLLLFTLPWVLLQISGCDKDEGDSSDDASFMDPNKKTIILNLSERAKIKWINLIDDEIILNAIDMSTGQNISVTGYDYPYEVGITTQYKATGDVRWQVEHDANFLNICSDTQNNVYLTGYQDLFDDEYYQLLDIKMITCAYDAGGELLWKREEEGDKIGAAVNVDYENNIVAAGRSNKSYLIYKYDSASGEKIWEFAYEFENGSIDNRLHIWLYDSGNIYINGYSHFSCILLKIDADGNLLWERDCHPSDNVAEEGYGVIGNEAGDIYVIADCYASSTCTYKYDTDGNLLWWRKISDSEVGRYIALNDQGYPAICAASITEGFITVQYDDMGNELWVNKLKYLAGEYSVASGLATDKKGNVYLTGWICEEILGDYDFGMCVDYLYVVIKYNAGGEEEWILYQDDEPAGESTTSPEPGPIFVTFSYIDCDIALGLN